MYRLVSTVATIGAACAGVWLLQRRRSTPGERWYATVYRALYRLGWRVWERSTPAADLLALVEGACALPPDRALDLGCGSGTDSVYLAAHGWEVTGIDIVPQALELARQRAATAGVRARFIQADVTRLEDAGVHGPYTLVLDFGCLHTLPPDQRPSYVTSVSAVAAPGATFLVYGFARPPALAPMQAGLTEAEVRERFTGAGWDIIQATPVERDAIQVARARVDRSFELWRYRLVRRESLTPPP
jgi:SAM-dependent methyltransferase